MEALITGEEARKRAEQMQDSITKRLMLEIADSYERIAKVYEEQPSIFTHGDR